MKPLLVLALALAFCTTPAAAQTANVDTEASMLEYRGRHPSHNWRGTSRSVTGEVAYDAANPAASRIMISAPIASFDSGNGTRDANMRKLLNEPENPNVTFTSESVEVTASSTTDEGYVGTWQVAGTLDFNGQRRPLTIEVEVTVSGGLLRAVAAFPVSLTAYEVKRPKLLFVPMRDTLEMEAVIVATL
ncbi:MAG: YceI family protein [Bacteroidota bacterium]